MITADGEDVMRLKDGDTIPFAEYLRRVTPKRARPAIWRGRKLADRLNRAELTERGVVALMDGDGAKDATVAPGLSCVIQVVPPASSTRLHSHSFWHLCLVRGGSGTVSVGDDGIEDDLTEGDTLFIPAWCSHGFSNRGGQPLVMMVIQNLPSLADAGTVARQDASEPIRVVYSDALD